MTQATDRHLDDIVNAIGEVRAGRPIVVVADGSPEAPGSLVFAAQHATTELLAFTVRHTAGYVTVALTPEAADALDLPALQLGGPGERRGTGYGVTVDARDGISTGISAADRALGIRLIADPQTQPEQLSRPGHLVTIRTHPGGVLVRRAIAEAAVDFAYLAQGRPVGVFSALVSMNDPTQLAHGSELCDFAEQHGFAVVSIADLARHRRLTDQVIERAGEARIPLVQGEFLAIGYRSLVDEREHIALVLGDRAESDRIHVLTECLVGHAFGALHCDCQNRLTAALEDIAAAGNGVLVYVRGSQTSGSGLMALLATYRDRDSAAQLCGPPDPSELRIAHQILRDLR